MLRDNANAPASDLVALLGDVGRWAKHHPFVVISARLSEVDNICFEELQLSTGSEVRLMLRNEIGFETATSSNIQQPQPEVLVWCSLVALAALAGSGVCRIARARNSGIAHTRSHIGFQLVE